MWPNGLPPPGPPSEPPGEPGDPPGPPGLPPIHVTVRAPTPHQKLDVAKPDKFSGDKRHLLEIFLNQCLNNFLANPRVFQNERNRITFAGSYLSGRANTWWGGYLSHLDSDEPAQPWLRTWSLFRDELIYHFGVIDPRAHALVEIWKIRQGSSQRLSDYKLEFNELAKYLDWNDSALADRFFMGLQPRIVEVLASRTTPRPTTLDGLAVLCASIDNNYWLYRDTSKASGKHSGDSGHANSSSPRHNASSSSRNNSSGNSSRNNNASSSRNNNSGSSGNNSRNNNNNSNSNRNSGNSGSSNARKSSSSGNANKPDLTGKLNATGKLTNEERQRRLDNDLCLYCGLKGHGAKDCRKAAHNRETSGRAAMTESPSATPATSSKTEN